MFDKMYFFFMMFGWFRVVYYFVERIIFKWFFILDFNFLVVFYFCLSLLLKINWCDCVLNICNKWFCCIERERKNDLYLEFILCDDVLMCNE